jgi:hypothetical protein
VHDRLTDDLRQGSFVREYSALACSEGYGMYRKFRLDVLARCLGIGVVLCALPANAETLNYRNLNRTAEAAWSNCPATPVVDGQLCNYTAVFAAHGNNFQPFIILQLMNLRVHFNGTTEIVAAGTGYVQPAQTVTVANTLAAAAARGAAYLYGNCGDPNDLSTCAFLGMVRWRSIGQRLIYP